MAVGNSVSPERLTEQKRVRKDRPAQFMPLDTKANKGANYDLDNRTLGRYISNLRSFGSIVNSYCCIDTIDKRQ